MIKKKLKINVFDIVTSEIVSITNSEKRKLSFTIYAKPKKRLNFEETHVSKLNHSRSWVQAILINLTW